MKSLALPPNTMRLLAALFLALLWVGPLALAAPAEPLTLRLNDTEGRAGELVALVVRTYAPRGVGQGQLCFRTLSQFEAVGDPGPFVALEDFIVWSSADDAVSSASFDDATQTAILDFSSVSGSINLEDGPMAAIIFRLRDGLPANSSFEIELDGLDSFLFDPEGLPVPIEIRSGELDILPLAAPRNLEAEGDETPPGGLAQLGISTQEIFPISQGQIAFEYDANLTQTLPEVTVDSRHGNAIYVIDLTQAGRILVSFDSSDQSLNSVPGQFLRIALRLRPDLPIGTVSAVRIDGANTFLEGPEGIYPLVLEEDVIEVIADTPLFADGFESATFEEWSSHSP